MEDDRPPPADKGSEVGAFDKLLSKVPHTVWQPNAVVQRHRTKANLWWLCLLLGYIAYIIVVIINQFQGRKNPPVQMKVVDDPFQLPDVGFCFEGDTYGSRFACFDEADGRDCASSLRGDAFVYGYNKSGYTVPEGYAPSSDHIVLLPEAASETCQTFKLSELETSGTEKVWNFHMLMFWNSSYDPSVNPGAFQSVKMYLYTAGLDDEERQQTPISLYAPISFDVAVVPFVRGFLEYERRTVLSGNVIHTYSILDVTSSPWHNAEDADQLAAAYGTDALASIQIDVRRQSYTSIEEVDPLDIVGTLGEVSGFWLVVPLMFGALFYQANKKDDEIKEMRRVELPCCKRRRHDGSAV